MSQDTSVILNDIQKQKKIIKDYGYGAPDTSQKQKAKARLQKYCTVSYDRNVRLAATKSLLECSSNKELDLDSLRLALRLNDFSVINYIGKMGVSSSWLSDKNDRSVSAIAMQPATSVRSKAKLPFHQLETKVEASSSSVASSSVRSAFSASSASNNPRDDQPSSRIKCFWSHLYLLAGSPIQDFATITTQVLNQVSAARSLAEIHFNDEGKLATECRLSVYEFCLKHRHGFHTIRQYSTEVYLKNYLERLPKEITEKGPAFAAFIRGLQFENGFFDGIVDLRQAFLQFKEACAQADATASMWFKLAGYYAKGAGVPRDPIQEEISLRKARTILRNIKSLPQADADDIYLEHLKNLWFVFHSQIALGLLKEFYIEMIKASALIQGAGIVKEFSEVICSAITRSDSPALSQPIQRAQQELAGFQNDYQQDHHKQYVEQMIDYHYQVLTSDAHSETEKAQAREKLGQLSDEGDVLATAKLVSYYCSVLGGSSRAIFYNTRLSQLDPAYVWTDERVKENPVVMWFYSFEKLNALMEQPTLPTRQQIARIIQDLTSTAAVSRDVMLERELQYRLYVFYSLVLETIALTQHKSAEDLELESYITEQHALIKQQVDALNPHFVKALTHIRQKNYSQALPELEQSTQPASVAPLVWFSLATYYANASIAKGVDEKRAAVSSIDLDKERACLEALQKLVENSKPFIFNVIILSLEVSLRQAIHQSHSVNALTMLKELYLKKMQQCKLSERVEECFAQFKDDISGGLDAPDFALQKKQAIEQLDQSRKSMIGEMCFIQAEKYKNESQFILALPLYIKAALQCEHEQARAALAMAYLKAGEVLFKHDPRLAQDYLNKAVAAQSSIVGEVQLVYMRAAINGYHPEKPGQIDYAFAFQLCQAVIDVDVSKNIPMSSKVSLFQFLYQHAFYEHQLAGFTEWLRSCFDANNRDRASIFVHSIADSQQQLQFYILLSLIADAQQRLGVDYTQPAKQQQVAQLSADVTAALRILEENLDALSFENNAFKSKLKDIKVKTENAVRVSNNMGIEPDAPIDLYDEKVGPLPQPVTISVVPEQKADAALTITAGKTIDKSLPTWKTPMPAVTANISLAVKLLLHDLQMGSSYTKQRPEDIINTKKIQAYSKPPHNIADRIAAANYLSHHYYERPDRVLHYNKLIFQLGNAASIRNIIELYNKTQKTTEQQQYQDSKHVKVVTGSKTTYAGNYRRIIDFWTQTYLLAELPTNAADSELYQQYSAAHSLAHADENSPEDNLVVYEFYLKNYADLNETNRVEDLEKVLPPLAKIPDPYDIYLQGLQHEYGYPTGTSDFALAFQYFKAATAQAPQHVTAWMWFKLAEYYMTGKGMLHPDPQQARFCLEQARAKISNIQDLPKTDADTIYISKVKEMFYHYHATLALQLLQEFYQQRMSKVSIEHSAGVVSEFLEIVSVVEPDTKDPVFLQQVQEAQRSLNESQQGRVLLEQENLSKQTINNADQILVDDTSDTNAKQQALLDLLHYSREGNLLAIAKLFQHYCRSGAFAKAFVCWEKCALEDHENLAKQYKQYFNKNDGAMFYWCSRRLMSFTKQKEQLLLTNPEIQDLLSVLKNLVTSATDQTLIPEIKLVLYSFYAEARSILGPARTYVAYQAGDAEQKHDVKPMSEGQQASAYYESENVSLMNQDENMGPAMLHFVPGIAYAMGVNGKPDLETAIAQFELATQQADVTITLWLHLAACDRAKELDCLQNAKMLADKLEDPFFSIRLRELIRLYESANALSYLYQMYIQKLQADQQSNSIVVEHFKNELDFPTSEDFNLLKQQAIEQLIKNGNRLVSDAAYSAAIKHTQNKQYELALRQYLLAAQHGDQYATDCLPQAYINAGEVLISSDPTLAMQHFANAITDNPEMVGKVDLALARAAINGYHPDSRGVADFQLAFRLYRKVMTSAESKPADCSQVLGFLYNYNLFEVDEQEYLNLLQDCPQSGNEQDIHFFADQLVHYLQSRQSGNAADAKMTEQDDPIVRQALALRDAIKVPADVTLGVASVRVVPSPSPAQHGSSTAYLHAMGMGGGLVSDVAAVENPDHRVVSVDDIQVTVEPQSHPGAMSTYDWERPQQG